MNFRRKECWYSLYISRKSIGKTISSVCPFTLIYIFIVFQLDLIFHNFILFYLLFSLFLISFRIYLEVTILREFLRFTNHNYLKNEVPGNKMIISLCLVTCN
jgi:hypothetical protein